MRPSEVVKLGIPQGESLKQVLAAMASLAAAGITGQALRDLVKQLADNPSEMLDHPQLGLAAEVLQAIPVYKGREEPAPWRMWGNDIEDEAIQQLKDACSLPVSVAGALMPDGHFGYGLPIGGVLATRGVVIPYAVGVDIACRMRISVLELPLSALHEREEELIEALECETRFGIGASFKAAERRQHAVMDEDWNFLPLLAEQKDQAWSQLGSSGGGNHFVEYGVFTVDIETELGLAPGRYLAMLSHSGSRGTGAKLAQHFSKLAAEKHPELPRNLQRLAWLDLDSEDGQAYWAAMNLMGQYAAANHELIHRHITSRLGVEVIASVENHHNFAWIEEHFGEQVIVHRKGATPAGPDAIGVIPGSMATPCYIVRGLGHPESLHSASHGAGRKMSRTEAKRRFSWREAQDFLKERKVRLISGGLDEAPMAYKDIESVMAAQQDLVTPLARFDPRLVKMAPENSRKKRRRRR